jgi:hypothetical protein
MPAASASSRNRSRMTRLSRSCLPLPLGPVGLAVDQADAQHRAAALQRRIRVGRAVVDVEDLGQAAAHDRGAEGVLAGAGVLGGHPAAMHQQPGMVIHQHKQLGALAAGDAGAGDVRPAEHVADPALAWPLGLVAAQHPGGLGPERGAVQALAAQMRTHGPLADHDPMAGAQDVGDMGRRAGRLLGPQRGRLGEQLGVAAHHPGVRPLGRAQPVQAAGLVGGDPAVQRATGERAHRPVGMGVGGGGQRTDDAATLGRPKPGVGGLGDHPVAEQGDLLGGIVRAGRAGGRHSHLLQGGGLGAGGIQPGLPSPAQGGLVVAASHPPPLTSATSGQHASAAPPSRPRTNAATACRAAKQARSAATPAPAATSPPSSTSSAPTPAASTGAPTRNRHQSRTVVCGTPKPAATTRSPAHPPPAPAPPRSPPPRPGAVAAQTTAAAHASPRTVRTWPAAPRPASSHHPRAPSAGSPTTAASAGRSSGSPVAGPGRAGRLPRTARRPTGKAIRWPWCADTAWTLPERQLPWEGPSLVHRLVHPGQSHKSIPNQRCRSADLRPQPVTPVTTTTPQRPWQRIRCGCAAVPPRPGSGMTRGMTTPLERRHHPPGLR